MNQMKETTNVTTGENLKSRDDARTKVKKIAFIGLMGAVSAVLMLFRFPIPFMPPFLSFDLSGLMEMLGGFMFGPMAAACIIVVKILLKLLPGNRRIAESDLKLFLRASGTDYLSQE